MTQEEKQLLLLDLCARLPYGVICHYDCVVPSVGKVINYDRLNGIVPVQDTIGFMVGVHTVNALFDNIKPYLRPLSSMTEEEKIEMHNLLSPEGTAIYKKDGIALPNNHYGEYVPYEFMNRVIQYLLKNHFDFVGLIPKGLAIAVTKENNPYEN